MTFTAGDGNLLQLNQASFDFNIQFEQLFFSIVPSAIFIVTSLWRTVVQAKKPTVVNAPVFQLIKLGAIATYVGLELSLLILAAVGSFHVTSIFIAASVLELVSALFMIMLSLVDHSKSSRPSALLSSYLFLTLLLDAAKARTLFLSSNDKPEVTYSALFCAAIALKVSILLLEAQQKSRWLSWDEKEHSPEETSGIFSLGVFFWLNRIFWEGYRKILTLHDLYPLDCALDARALHDQFLREMDYAQLKGHKYGLVKVLARTLQVSILLPIIPRLALLGFTFCQPFFIQALVNHLSASRDDSDIGYGLIGASVIIYSGIAISTAFYWYFHHRTRAMARSILVTETFGKATRARLGASDDSAAVTLMSTDIERISNGFRFMHELWAGMIQVALATWLLYDQLGAAFITPMVVVVVCFTALIVLVKFTAESQRAWMAGVQKRVGLTATVVSNMKNLKMSGLAGAIGDFVQELRVTELTMGSRFRKIGLFAAIFGYVPLILSPVLTFAFTTSKLETTRIFTSLSYLLLLTNPLAVVFQTIPDVISGLACLGRIQAFIECEDREDFRRVLTDIRRSSQKLPAVNVAPTETQSGTAYPITVENGRFGWEEGKFVLNNINTRIARSSLTLVVGPVGSGKSTFCKALLGEAPFSEGHVDLSTRLPHVGYCDQTTFLANGTIRDNIVGFSTFDPERYAEVIRVTALGYDLGTLADGDQANVGSDGITLSGGQRQRVALARALYLYCDLLIFDDVFSGLDRDTEEQVFRQVFGSNGLLRRRRSTVILSTHSIRHLPAADYIIALGDGSIAEQGSFSQLLTGQGYVRRLGLTSTSGDGSPEESDTETDTEGDKPERSAVVPVNTTFNLSSDGLRQVGDKTVYMHYIRSMGISLALFSVFTAALWGFFTNFSTIWLTFWSDSIAATHPNHSNAYYIGIYGLLRICGLISLTLIGLAIFIMSVERSGASLHRNALRTLIRAPLRFFTSTDTGVVTNLFSQDLNLIDTELPNALLGVLVATADAVGQAIVMLTASPYIAISYPFLIGLLYLVQKFYLRTSRQMRLLDLEAKSPLYTHFIDTLKGIATFRAFGFVPNDIQKNIDLINTSQRPAYLLMMIQQWLTLVLDIVVMIVASVLTTLAVRLHSNSGFAGASLVTLMGFGDALSSIVISYTKLETSIGAIARLKSFNETVKPEEVEGEDVVPLEQWPHNGAIELKNVSASYSADTSTSQPPKLALRNLNLTIPAGSKFAICGRTGSGKSSLVALLLKLLDPLLPTRLASPSTAVGASGVTIDGLPLSAISRPALRQRILAVPQEAVFLPDGSTFRANLDPSNDAATTPEECLAVLAVVGLADFVAERGGLEAGMSAGTLSAGQRQLLSLGRVLLRRRIRARKLGFGGGEKGAEGGILLLDEVSSNVDYETEKVMQEIIRVEFAGYTVVAVSHRLDMIMDFDQVVVMDTGEVVEEGNPRELAAQDGTRFGELLSAGGR